MISSFDGTNTLYYHDSNLGNVNQITNNSGTVIQTYDYDAFGNITNQTGSLTTKYAYKTKEYSPETGLIFFGASYYNPLIGRFITKDPLGMVDGPNQYIYCWNDPVNKIDPWGLWRIPIWYWKSTEFIGTTNTIKGEWKVDKQVSDNRAGYSAMIGTTGFISQWERTSTTITKGHYKTTITKMYLCQGLDIETEKTVIEGKDFIKQRTTTDSGISRGTVFPSNPPSFVVDYGQPPAP